jgi:hypothetical protein
MKMSEPENIKAILFKCWRKLLFGTWYLVPVITASAFLPVWGIAILVAYGYTADFPQAILLGGRWAGVSSLGLSVLCWVGLSIGSTIVIYRDAMKDERRRV